MAGHSKWHNIKHRKAGQDAKRGKMFTKIIREIMVAAREGGGIIEDNPSLRNVVDKAKGAQMPKDTIERAIARGAGGGEGAELARLTYEGYGPGGVAILVETMTDNKNRTVAEVRHAFSKGGGNLGTDGSVAFMFEKRGQISLAPGADEDTVMEIALEAGAEEETGQILKGKMGEFFLMHLQSSEPLLENGSKAAISAAMIKQGGYTWFFKMTGDADTVRENRKRFESFVQSAAIP